ncbi:unnamed protein product, partial [Effrenium voratum]
VLGRFSFHSLSDDVLRPKSPRAVIPTARGRGDGEAPAAGPPLRRCHSPGVGTRTTTFPRTTRDTFQFIPLHSEGAGRLYSPRHERSRGGTMGFAQRFRSASPRERSPGPQSYRPSVAFSSTFRR